MKSIIDTITYKIHTLHSILSSILPIESITKCPFEHYSNKINRIYNFIDTIIKESQEEQEKIRNGLKSDFKFTNLYLEKEYALNDNFILEKRKKQRKSEIRLYENLICELLNELSFDSNSLILDNQNNFIKHINIYKKQIENSNPTSNFTLEEYKNLYSEILCTYNRQERNRLEFYKQIIIWKDKLRINIDLNVNDKLNNIYKQYNELKDIIDEREKKLKKLITEIVNKQNLLNTTSNEEKLENANFKDQIKISNNKIKVDETINDVKENIFNKNIDSTNDTINQDFLFYEEDLLDYNNLSDDYFYKLEIYKSHLETQYKLKLEEIYTSNIEILNNLLLLFNLPSEKYEMTDEDIQKLKIRINSLKMKESFYIKITDLINKRSDLIQMMNEFEIIASDPKRLFKSSFQLNKEEKFRKNAVPNLLRIENELMLKINEYKQQFGDFIYNGEKYEDILKRENENRIMNKTVFINKYDSPYKKR